VNPEAGVDRFWRPKYVGANPITLTILIRRAFDSIFLRYRVGIINDFKEVYAYVDYQKLGDTTITAACEVKGKHKGYQDKDDAIHIFLNFNKVGVMKTKSEAVSLLNKLVEECPKFGKKDLEEFKEYLFRGL